MTPIDKNLTSDVKFINLFSRPKDWLSHSRTTILAQFLGASCLIVSLGILVTKLTS